MTVFCVNVTFLTFVTVIVTGEDPQLKVIIPPIAMALVKADSLQLVGVPVPTTVVGLLMLTRLTGGRHTVGGALEYRIVRGEVGLAV
jgi:hypothetical protein